MKRTAPLTCAALIIGAASLAAPLPGFGSGTVMVPAAAFGNLEVRVTSMKQAQFRTTLPQQYDFSCGSAALATLLSHHYQHPVSEAQVFDDMYAKGEQEKIKREGFSLLDMKNYLERNGFKADGFRISLDQLRKVGVPAIALINRKGFRHFVVLQGVSEQQVLIGDPALGSRVLSREEFQQMWNGLLFLIRNRKEVAQSHFNSREDWSVQPKAPVAMGLAGNQVMNQLLFLPVRNGL